MRDQRVTVKGIPFTIREEPVMPAGVKLILTPAWTPRLSVDERVRGCVVLREAEPEQRADTAVYPAMRKETLQEGRVETIVYHLT